ncbi:hypothetical protein ACFHWD_03855 [Clostridium sp. MT-14]|uniref:hypothetical protein n=1 Tax=Clostridium sp. MT-14 TaxID=3348360 RepID=UPI0035F3010A
MPKLNSIKQYIKEQLVSRGLDQYGQIRIDFSGLCTEAETKAAANALRFETYPAEGQGCFWLF